MTMDSGKKLLIIIDNISEFECVTWTDGYAQISQYLNIVCSLLQYHIDELQYHPGDGSEPRMRPGLKALIPSSTKSISLRQRVEITRLWCYIDNRDLQYT